MKSALIILWRHAVGAKGAVYAGLFTGVNAHGKEVVNSPVAVKVMQAPTKDDVTFCLNEIETMRSVFGCPHVAGYQGAYKFGGEFWLLLELCDLGSITRIMNVQVNYFFFFFIFFSKYFFFSFEKKRLLCAKIVAAALTRSTFARLPRRWRRRCYGYTSTAWCTAT